MLYRAVQLQTPIERFQERPLDDDAKEVSYSALDDQINADDWREIRQYLTLLGPFVEATHHLEGNAEHEGDEGLRGSIWEVFIWMQTLYSKVTKRLDKLPKSPKTPFRTALEFGKEKMDEYWTKMIYQTPYYYASIILHPDHGVAWFDKHWKGYAPWVKKVKTGMKDFVITYGKTLEGDADSEEEMRAVARKLPDAVVRRREEQRLLGILDSDEERETFALPPAKRRELVAELRTKQPRIETELDSWYRYHPAYPVNNPLLFWIGKSKDSTNLYPLLTKLALDIYSIPAMSAECERVFSQAKRVITDDRNRLSATTIEAIQCQKNWLSQHLVHSDLDTVLEHAKNQG